MGISSLEAKRHEVTGEHVLMEINIRIPRTSVLERPPAWIPSWRVYATLAGIPLAPARPQRDGVRVIVPTPRGARGGRLRPSRGPVPAAAPGLIPEGCAT